MKQCKPSAPRLARGSRFGSPQLNRFEVSDKGVGELRFEGAPLVVCDVCEHFFAGHPGHSLFAVRAVE